MSGVLVVGNGPAALRLTLALHAHGYDGAVTVLGDGVVQRALLPSLLDGSLPPDAPLLAGHPPTVRVHRHARAVRVDRRRRLVLTADGTRYPYDTLVLATGAHPRIPRLPGLRTRDGKPADGVLTLRRPGDPARIGPGPVVVLGAGPRGVETALALRRGGRETVLLDRAPAVLPGLLDPTAAELVGRRLTDAGVTLRLGRTAVEYAPGKLLLDDGEVLDTPTLVLCTGFVPRTRLAADAGLTVRRGVLVDPWLRTDDPRVSAVGECAEPAAPAPPGAPVAFDPAAALAARLAGAGTPAAPPETVRLRDPRLDVAVLGRPPAPDDTATERITLHDPARHRYARLTLRDQRVEEAVLVGLPHAIAALTQLHQRGLPVPAARLALLLGTPPRGATRAGPPGDAVLCRCNHVTRHDLTRAWSHGAHDLPALAAATRATTGCGGCAPDVERLCAALAAAREGPRP